MRGRIGTIARRELASYFDHATAYILLVVFLVINFFFFFREAYVVGEASLRPMLSLLPWLFLFFVPAVCMRALAEERREGTLELVLAQPIGVGEFLIGKFLGVYLFLGIAMAGTFGLPLGLSLGADLQWGVVFAQYVGSALLLAALVAVGLWASSMTQNQVTAFILGVTATFALYLVGIDVVVLGLPAWLSAIATRLGILGHFQNVARGVIDLRDVLYFLAVTAAFLSLTYFSIMRERLSRARREYARLRIGALALVALAIFVALAGSQLRGRLDLTPGQLYTLSEPTRELLGDLDDLVTITFFRSDDLPPEYGPVRRDVEDLLRDFDAAGGGNLNLVRIDPQGDEEAEAEASSLGIEQARFNVFGEDQFSVREGYLGIAIQYAGQSEAIPLVQRTEELEYRLASMIRSMTRERRPVIGMLTGHGELDPRTQMSFATGRMSEEYTLIERLSIDSTAAIPDSISVVVIAGTSTPLAMHEGEAISRFLERGGGLLLMLSGTRVDPRSRFANPAYYPTLDSLMLVRGLGVVPVLAFDLQTGATVGVNTAGGQLLTRYPLFPTAQITSNHVIVDGLSPVSLNWPSPLRLPDDSTRVTTLLSTTELGGELRTPASIDASQDWGATISEEDLAPQPLAAAYQDSTGARIVLVGSHLIVDDQVARQAGPAGIVFFQNAVDWLAQDEALISIRSKDRAPPQLLFPSELIRDLTRYGNLVGVPLLFVLLGMFRLARRRRSETRTYETGGAIL